MLLRKKTFRVGAIATAICALLLSGCASSSTAGTANAGSSGTMADMDPVVITVAEIDPEGTAWLESFAEYTREVEEKSDGKITFDLYTTGSLMPGTEMLTGIGSGAADMGRLITAYFPQELPVGNWSMALGGATEDSYPHGMFQGSAVAYEAHTAEGPLRSELEEHNLTPLMSYAQAIQYDMMCTEPVESMQDAKGMLTRSNGVTWAQEIESLGMVPVPLPPLEIYEGLQRGVIGCAALFVPNHVDYSYWDVAKNYVPVRFSQMTTMPLVINTDLWQSLPADAQQLLQESTATLWQSSMEGSLERYETFASKGVTEKGVVFNDPRALDKELKKFQEARVNSLPSTAPDSLENPEEYIANYLALNEKWIEIIDANFDMPHSERDPESIRNSYLNAPGVDRSALWSEIRTQIFTKP